MSCKLNQTIRFNVSVTEHFVVVDKIGFCSTHGIWHHLFIEVILGFFIWKNIVIFGYNAMRNKEENICHPHVTLSSPDQVTYQAVSPYFLRGLNMFNKKRKNCKKKWMITGKFYPAEV